MRVVQRLYSPLAVLTLAVACVGELGAPAGPPGIDPTSDAGTGLPTTHSTSDARVALDDGGDAGPSACVQAAAAMPMRRLSRFEYANVISDVFHLDGAALAALWPIDANGSGYDNDVSGQGPTAELVEQSMRSAETISDLVTADIGALIPECATPSAADCAGAFVDTIGRRLYRRSLTAEERTRLLTLESARGLRVMIMAMLQSPSFLYRVEEGFGAPDAEGRVELSPHELATRLAFFLTASTPDEPLLDAADRGALSDVAAIRAQAMRLLDGDGGARAIRHFYDQWLKIGRLESARKNESTFAAWSDETRSDLVEATRLFSERITLSDGNYTDLLTDSSVYVTRRTAPLLGLSPDDYDDTPRAVEITSHPRRGLLTDIGLLSGLAKSEETAPIARGVFVIEQLFCQHAPPPPNDLIIEPPAPDPTLTTRERYTAHREGSCAFCHALFDPAGFGLENYDAIGRFRERENDLVIDASGELRTNTTTGNFDGPDELAALIVGSEQARSCFAQQWTTYALGRTVVNADACMIDSVADPVMNDQPIREVLAAIATSPAFRTRAPVVTEECQ